jgi:hypothetical protein
MQPHDVSTLGDFAPAFNRANGQIREDRRPPYIRGVTSRRVTRIGLLIAVGAVALQFGAHLTDAFLFNGRHAAIQADGQGDLFDWATALALFAGSLCLLAGARYAQGGLRSVALAALLVFLAFDELVGVHERMASAVAPHLPGALSRLGDLSTPLVYLPLLAGVFVLLLSIVAETPWRVAPTLWLGLGLLIVAAFVRVVAASLKVSGMHISGMGRDVAVAFDQGFQLAAWLLIAVGLAAALAESSSLREQR